MADFFYFRDSLYILMLGILFLLFVASEILGSIENTKSKSVYKLILNGCRYIKETFFS